MNAREFFTAISTNETLSNELKDYAVESLAKLDARNEKRRTTPSKAQVANEPIKEAIVGLFHGNSMTASEVASAINISTQKASALLRQLVDNGTLAVAEVKVPKKGTVKSYSKAE